MTVDVSTTKFPVIENAMSLRFSYAILVALSALVIYQAGGVPDLSSLMATAYAAGQ